MSSCDRLQSDTSIPQGFSLVSRNEDFYATLQLDGSFVLYKKGHTQLWTSGSSNKGPGPYKLRMQLDGNLCIYGPDDNVLWSTNTKSAGSPPYQLKLQDDGNLCLYDTKKKCVWASNTAQV